VDIAVGNPPGGKSVKDKLKNASAISIPEYCKWHPNWEPLLYKFSKSSSLGWKTNIFILGFLWVTSQWEHLIAFMTKFTSPWAPTQQVIVWLKFFWKLGLCLHGFKRVMVTTMEFHFGWVCLFCVQLSSLWNWCTLTRETSCHPAPPTQLCESSCKHPPSITLLVNLFGLFINWNVFLMLAC